MQTHRRRKKRIRRYLLYLPQTEHIAGKMIRIPNNICICQDCMQKNFDSMNQTGFSMDDMLNMNMGKMPNISMINLSDLQGCRDLFE